MELALHIGSGQAGLYTIPGWTGDFVDQAREHAENSRGASPVHYWAQIDSLGELVELLTDLRNPELGIGVALHQVGDRVHVIRSPVEIAYLDFHTHGFAGKIVLGRRLIDWMDWRELRGNGFDQLFAEEAEITFYGCLVAAGAEGELFLAECGSLFLRNRGGIVKAWRDVGWAVAGMDETAHIGPIASYTASVPYIILTALDETAHFDTQVTAEVRQRGGVTLRNAEHLLPHRMRRRARDYRHQFEAIMRNNRLSGDRRQRYADTISDLDVIVWHLDQQRSYDALYALYHSLQRYSEMLLRHETRYETSPPPMGGF